MSFIITAEFVRSLNEWVYNVRQRQVIPVKKLVLALFVLCFSISLNVNEQVDALSCARPNDLSVEFAKSTVVFKGKALNPNTAEYNWKVSFDVNTLWKGNLDYIAQGIRIGDMWLNIEKGQEYLILANPIEGHMTGNVCGNSMLWSKVSPEQADWLSEEETFEGSFWRPVYGIVIGGLLLVLYIGYLFIRYQRQSRV